MWHHVQWYICISISDGQHSTPVTGAEGYCEMLVSVSQSTEHNIPQGHNLQTLFCPGLAVNNVQGVFKKRPNFCYKGFILQHFKHCPLQGLVWYMDGSRTAEGTGAGVYGQSVNRRLSIPLGKHATVFQAEVYAILGCTHEIEAQDRPEKYVSISALIARRL